MEIEVNQNSKNNRDKCVVGEADWNEFATLRCMCRLPYGQSLDPEESMRRLRHSGRNTWTHHTSILDPKMESIDGLMRFGF